MKICQMHRRSKLRAGFCGGYHCTHAHKHTTLAVTAMGGLVSLDRDIAIGRLVSANIWSQCFTPLQNKDQIITVRRL